MIWHSCLLKLIKNNSVLKKNQQINVIIKKLMVYIYYNAYCFLTIKDRPVPKLEYEWVLFQYMIPSVN